MDIQAHSRGIKRSYVFLEEIKHVTSSDSNWLKFNYIKNSISFYAGNNASTEIRIGEITVAFENSELIFRIILLGNSEYDKRFYFIKAICSKTLFNLLGGLSIIRLSYNNVTNILPVIQKGSESYKNLDIIELNGDYMLTIPESNSNSLYVIKFIGESKYGTITSNEIIITQLYKERQYSISAELLNSNTFDFEGGNADIKVNYLNLSNITGTTTGGTLLGEDIYWLLSIPLNNTFNSITYIVLFSGTKDSGDIITSNSITITQEAKPLPKPSLVIYYGKSKTKPTEIDTTYYKAAPQLTFTNVVLLGTELDQLHYFWVAIPDDTDIESWEDDLGWNLFDVMDPWFIVNENIYIEGVKYTMYIYEQLPAYILNKHTIKIYKK